MTQGSGRLVYYSIAALGSDACERQWLHSIESLRRWNRTVPVVLVLYGAPRAETLRAAERFGVQVVFAGAYEACFAGLPPRVAAVLACNPTLHKIPSLRRFSTEGVDQVLFLDCDTHLFSDVAWLFELYRSRHLFAREEPMSRRCPSGGDPAYLDEDELARVAAGLGLAAVAPFNTGVMLLNGRAFDHLRALSDAFLWTAWRLHLGLSLGSPLGAALDERTSAMVTRNTTREDLRFALPFPSSNAWILEEMALWLTLGRIPGLMQGFFAPGDVAQGGDAPSAAQEGGRILAHYFSSGEAEFMAALAQVPPEPIEGGRSWVSS